MLGTLSIFLRPPIQVFFFFLHSLFLQLSNSSYCKLVFVIISIDIILFYLPSVLGSCSACVFMFYLGLKRVRQRGMLICLWGRILRRCFPVTCCKCISWLGGDMLSVCLHFFLHDTSCQPPAVHCVWVATSHTQSQMLQRKGTGYKTSNYPPISILFVTEKSQLARNSNRKCSLSLAQLNFFLLSSISYFISSITLFFPRPLVYIYKLPHLLIYVAARYIQDQFF